MKLFPVALGACILSVSQSSAVVLSLKNLSVAGSRHTLTADGIEVYLGGSSKYLASTSLYSDAVSFGLDSAGSDDAFGLIDGGSGTAEVVNLMFDQDVFVDSVYISFFGPNDAGSISIKGSLVAELQSGYNDLGGVVAGGSSLNTISWTGSNVSDPELGFSIDEITFRPVPEPSSALLICVGGLLGSMRRSRFSRIQRVFGVWN